ncbi:MAG: rod shape-determining protein MreC [Candidatus Paceibacterota bacterium]|jgi:cell shape-determining protein MreC
MKTFKGLLRAIFLVICFVILIFFRKEASDFFSYSRNFIAHFFDSAYSYQVVNDLTLENASLKRELAALQTVSPDKKGDFSVSVEVYSRYPFNDKSSLVINKGTADGIAVGMPVLAAKNILLGRIKAVRTTQSEVETIFSADWKTSAFVGAGRVKAVVQGGIPPHLELIPKDALLVEGDSATNSAPEFPLGLLIGTVTTVRDDEKKVWHASDIATPYQIEELRSVLVLTHFP